MNNCFKGTGVAVVTPFHKDGSIDFDAFKNVIHHTISNHVDYIVVLGTTGESVVLSKDEKNAIIHFAAEIIDKRVPLVAGVGGNCTNEVVNNFADFCFDIVHALLSVTPYYNKPHQKGLFAHYKTIAERSPLPVILYNVPDRTGVNMTAETTLKLAHNFDNIIGIKEASKDMEQCAMIVRNKPENFLVISGDDLLTLPLIAMGGDGAISVTANAYPKEFSQMVRHALEHDFLKARALFHKLTLFMTAIFMDGNPAGIKAALNQLDIIQNYLRLPSVPVSRKTYSAIKKAMEVLE